MSSMSAGVMRLMGIVCFRFNGREVAKTRQLRQVLKAAPLQMLLLDLGVH